MNKEHYHRQLHVYMNQYNIIWLRPFYVIYRCTCINSENGACTYMYYLFFPHTIARSRIHMWLFSFYELVALNELSPIKILHIFYFSTKKICIMLYTFCQRAKSRHCAYELMCDNMGKKNKFENIVAIGILHV